MASASVTTLILFIASMLVAASVAGVLTDEVGRLSSAINDQGIDVSHQVRTNFEIISDSGSNAVYNATSDNVTLYLKNTGSARLGSDTGDFDVILDGTYHGGLNATVLDGQSWDPGVVVRLRIYEPNLSSGDHRVKVIVDGDQEVFKFRA